MTDRINSAIPIFNSGIVSFDQLTPDGMLLYLQSRLGALDEQTNTIISKQHASEAARKGLQGIQNTTAHFGEDGGEVDVALIAGSLNDIAHEVNPNTAAEVFTHLPEPIKKQLRFDANSGTYEATGASATLNKQDAQVLKTYVETAIKDIESGSELEMIRLQSLMSARNTAISLATNMMSAVGKGAESIVGNIGR